MTAPTQLDPADDDLTTTAAAPAPAPATTVTTVKGVGLLAREPVRLYLYAIAAAVLVLLVAYGVLTTDLATVWGGVATAILSVPVTEGIRSKVTPAP